MSTSSPPAGPQRYPLTSVSSPDGSSRRLEGAELAEFWTGVNDMDLDALAEGRLDAVFSQQHAPEVAAQAMAFGRDINDEF